ncbi:MAG: FkbM family methyltransferase [Kiritimatiellales bacterium]|nr:FkbM family methyltransferase [Kiritimatiellota bacterium]MBL7012346.1 FkbM family methyltransferase [Kiritimatiellales bacterium]
MEINDSFRFWITGGRLSQVCEFYDLIRPQASTGLRKVRVGNVSGDGGYIMADDFDDIRVALSLGIADEISWDEEMTRRGVDVFQFDHTVDPPAQVETNPRLHFYKCGVAGKTDLQKNLKNIENILMDEIGDQSGDLILKMDIEGSEWESLLTISDETLKRFRQICIEIHNPLARPAQRVLRNRNLNVLRKLHRNFAPIHFHANNEGMDRNLFGIVVPRAIEVTYIRRDGQVFFSSDEVFPGKLDVPNSPDRSDVMLTEILRAVDFIKAKRTA